LVLHFMQYASIHQPLSMSLHFAIPFLLTEEQVSTPFAGGRTMTELQILLLISFLQMFNYITDSL